jgi:acyl carrier protein
MAALADPDLSVRAAAISRQALASALALSPERAAALADDTPLFGAMPEMDSMSVAAVLGEIEERAGIIISDDAPLGEAFATFGALTRFIAARLPA